MLNRQQAIISLRDLWNIERRTNNEEGNYDYWSYSKSSSLSALELSLAARVYAEKKQGCSQGCVAKDSETEKFKITRNILDNSGSFIAY